MSPLTRREFVNSLALLAGGALLAGCSPTEEPAMNTPTLAPTPVVPTPRPTSIVNTLTPVVEADLPPLSSIALGRLTFGRTQQSLASFQALGSSDEERLQAWLEQQLKPENLPDTLYKQKRSEAGFETLDKGLEALVSDHIVHNPYKVNDDRHWQFRMQPVNELQQDTFLRAVYSEAQLQEILVDFWHNHFNVYAWDGEVQPVFASYDRDAIRKNVFGNFRQFVEDIAKHPFMLFYLDNRSNAAAGPNENFARELFELHTLGAENYLGVRNPREVETDASGVAIGYVDNDVYEAARAFTGWRVNDDVDNWEDGVDDSGTFLYYRPWHDRFNKLILGQYFPADQADMKDGQMVLDMLCNHPGTARHIAGKLCRRLVSDDPPYELIDEVANVFYQHRDAPDQLSQVYRALITSTAFRSTWGGKLSRPFEIFVSSLRQTGAEFTRLPGGIIWASEQMGQPLFGHLTPDGYPDDANSWCNSMVSLFSWNTITGLVENWWEKEDDQPIAGVTCDLPAQTPEKLQSAEEIVSYWEYRLLSRPLPPASHKAIVDFLRYDAGANEPLSQEYRDLRLNSAVSLIMFSPQYRLQ